MNSLLVITLVLLIYEDIKERKVYVMLLFLFTILQLAAAYRTNGFHVSAIFALINAGLVLLMLAGVYVYSRIRSKSLNELTGGGDWWFYLAFAPVFSLRAFTLFLLASQGFSLVWWCVQRINGRKETTIPLIATTGITYLVYLVCKQCFV